MFGTRTTSAPPSSNGSHQSAYAPPPLPRTGAVLSADVSIRGDVKFANELMIDGEVEGTITSAGRLTVGTHATVVGDIEAGSVTIHGSVEGNVLATQRCALEAGASLHGDIEAPRLAVNENASFVGSATISAKNG